MAQQTTTQRQRKTGTVIGNAMDKTVIVQVVYRKAHPLYHKIVKRAKKFYAHDKDNQYQIGDQVVIEETRPLSKLKHWRVVEKVQ